MTDQAVDVGGAAAGQCAGQFLGRQRELKELRADIERAGLDTLSGKKSPRARVLLIAGRPGSGRTALAAELARQVAGDYPDGVLRAALTEPGGARVPADRVARDLLDALEVSAPPGAGQDELTELVRGALASRRAIVLLDDAADAEQVGPLLPDTSRSLIVATAKGPLTGIPDVRPCTLGGLDTKAAVELLEGFTGSVRVTVDPRAAESLVEACAGQPAALVLVGGWLAARPKAAVSDVAKQLRALGDDVAELPSSARPLATSFRLVYECLSQPSARILRLLALAPAGIADAHTASALAGCSVSGAQTALGDFVAYGLLRRDPDVPEQFRVPGALAPLLRALCESVDRPGEVQLARARMLERTVRLLQSCRARHRTGGLGRPQAPGRPAARAALPEPRPRPRPGSAAEGPRCSPPPSSPCGTANSTPWPGAWSPPWCGRSPPTGAPRRPPPTCTACTSSSWTWPSGASCTARRRRPCSTWAIWTPGPGAPPRRWPATGSPLTPGRAANDPYATGRAMESVGGAHQELGDWQRASDWYGRALSQRLARGERADEARLYGRLATVHTYAGRYGEALRCWRAAVAGYRRLGDLPSQARALSEAARVQEYAGRPEESLRTCREAVEQARKAGDLRLQAALQLRLADTLDRLGDPAAAQVAPCAADRFWKTRQQPQGTCEIRSASAKG